MEPIFYVLLHRDSGLSTPDGLRDRPFYSGGPGVILIL